MTPSNGGATPRTPAEPQPAGVSHPDASAAAAEDVLYDRLQYQVAIFARRVEQVRMGGVGDQRNSMDRAAFLLLNRLDWTGAVGVKALAQAMGIDSSTVTRQVAPLVDCGLVERVPNPDDGRAVLLELSPLGRERLQEVRESRQLMMHQLLDGWSGEEREQFCELLTRFNASMQVFRP